MNQSELKHEWAVDPNAGWFRLWRLFYYWVEPNELTFCKLFWGFVLMPLALITLLPVRYLVKLVAALWEWCGLAAEEHSLRTKERRLQRMKEREEEPPPPPKPPREAVLITRIEAFASKAALKLSALSKIAGYIGLAIGVCALGAAVVAAVWAMIHFWPYTGYVVGGIVALALTCLAVLGLAALIMDHPEAFAGILVVGGIAAIIGAAIWAGITWWAITQSILMIGAAGIVALLFIIAVCWATIKFGSEPAMEYVLRPTHEHIFRPAAKGAGSAGVGFATVMKIGYRSVKTNTCPRIRIGE